MMKIGIYGGSFNPVHKGHIHLAKTVLNTLSLDRVYLVPSNISPHRSSKEYISGEDRMNILRLACKGDKRLIPCDYELMNDRKSYTIYTVEEFKRQFPNDELFLILGSDMFMCFETWKDYEKIMNMVTLAVASRKNGDRAQLVNKAEKLRNCGKIFICSAPAVEMSSTEIRKLIEKNEKIEKISCYLDENVVQYITSRNLYRGTDI